MAIGPVQNDVLPSSMSVIKSLIAGIYVCIMCINKIKGIIQVLPKCIGHMSMYVMLHCKLHIEFHHVNLFLEHIYWRLKIPMQKEDILLQVKDYGLLILQEYCKMDFLK